MDALEELLKALAEFQPPQPVEHVYRIYYDAATGEITKHTYNEELDIGPCLVFDLDGYEQAKATVNDSLVVGGRLVRRPPPQIALPLKRGHAGVATVRDNMVFVADDSVSAIEFWTKND